jgi:hypothetical protein
MNTFKKIDAGLQAILIIIFLLLTLINWPGEQVIVGYFVVGGVQVISMVVHAAAGPTYFPRRSLRRTYTFVVLAIFLAVPIAMLTDMLIFLMFGLLFASPIMALFYWWICFREVKELDRGPAEGVAVRQHDLIAK